MSHRSTGIYRILEWSSVYERVQRLLGAGGGRRRFVRQFVRPAASARILDIGCGAGAVLDALPDGVDYTGYDLNAKYIATAQRRYAGRGVFRRASVDEIPDDADGFDVVLAMALLHH